MAGALTALGLGAALLLAGLGFGSPSLLVPGVAFVGLAAAAAAWVELARPRRLIRAAAAERVVEGEPYRLRLDAVGARLPPPGGELFDSVLERPLALGPRWRGSYSTELRLTGRGRRRLSPSRIELRDPLGLYCRAIESDPPGDLLVLPRIEPVIIAGRGAGGAWPSLLGGVEEGAAASRLDARAIELEVDGLRAYRDGSPASRIHWPAVARTGELIERRLIAGADAAPLVVLDATRPAGSDALDAAVRAAASLCVHLAGRGGCGALLPGDRRPTEVEPDLRAWQHLHARFAVVEAGGPLPVLSRAPRSGSVFWVTAQASPRVPAQLRGAIGGQGFLVSPAGSGSRPVFAVGGCEGRPLGAPLRSRARAAA